MPDKNEVSLLVNGRKYTGWTSVKITVKLSSFARACELTAARTWGAANLTAGIENGSEAIVKIGSDLLITGYIVGKTLNYSASGGTASVNISINIKSKTVDLEECAIPFGKPHQWNGTVIDAVKAVAGYYGIEVVSNGLGENKQPVDFSTHDPIGGELTKLLKNNSLLINDDEKGRLVVCIRGSGGDAYDKVKLGVNVIDGKRVHDSSGVFKNWVVIGQQANPKSEDGLSGSAVSGSALNDYFPRERWSVTEQSGNRTANDLQKRANLLMANSIGGADTLTYTVQGWRQSNGELWKQNTNVRVEDELAGINEKLLVGSVTYSLSNEGGTTTTLELKAPDAFLATELPEEQKATASLSSSSKKKAKANNGTSFLDKWSSLKAGSGRIQ